MILLQPSLAHSEQQPENIRIQLQKNKDLTQIQTVKYYRYVTDNSFCVSDLLVLILCLLHSDGIQVVVTGNTEEEMPNPVMESQIVCMLIQPFHEKDPPDKQQPTSFQQLVVSEFRNPQFPMDISYYSDHRVHNDWDHSVFQIPRILLLCQYSHQQCGVYQVIVSDIPCQIQHVQTHGCHRKDIIKPMPGTETQEDLAVVDLAEVVHEAGEGTAEAHKPHELPVPLIAPHDQGYGGEVGEGCNNGHGQALLPGVERVVFVVVGELLDDLLHSFLDGFYHLVL